MHYIDAQTSTSRSPRLGLVDEQIRKFVAEIDLRVVGQRQDIHIFKVLTGQ